MKKLYIFSIRSFIGPFIVTFFVAMFILIMQTFWLYLDDLIGKGIPFLLIMELLFYVSMNVIPLAIPLAILLSSIMTFGNLGENNELTALKASGLSLYKIIRPLFVLICWISFSVFLFSNYIIPRANFKFHTLISDIQSTKVAALIKPGSYTKELEGYAIKVEKESQGVFYDITIHDHTDRAVLKTVKAAKGEIFKTPNGKHLFFKLENGFIMEELATQAPLKEADGTLKENADGKFRPARRTSFETATYKMQLTGFKVERSKDEESGSFEMLNVLQLNQSVDSLRKHGDKQQFNFANSIRNNHSYFQALLYVPKSEPTEKELRAEHENMLKQLKESNKVKAIMNQNSVVKVIENEQKLAQKMKTVPLDFKFDTLSKGQKLIAYEAAKSLIRNQKSLLMSNKTYLQVQEDNLRRYNIEIHKKFALSATIIVLFFIGAPLGAIVKKGGFGLPVVAAALLFMLYFILFSAGESMAQNGAVPSFIGMWFPTIVLTPFAIWLMVTAAKDRSLINTELFGKLFKRFKKKILKK